MAIVKYNEEWNKFFERMGQQDLPLLKKIGKKLLILSTQFLLMNNVTMQCNVPVAC